MPTGPGETPVVARRRVRSAVRKARQLSKLSQGEVAERLGWSLSKVQRIEAGEVTLSVTDFRALMELHAGVEGRAALPPREWAALLDNVRVARRQRWWTAPEYRQHLSSATMELMGFEAEAAEIRTYQSALVPGLLQTPLVIEAILAFWEDLHEWGPSAAERRKVRSDVRARRRQHVIENEDAPLYHLILDESVLARHLGGLQAAVEQMAALEAAAARPRVHIRVLPLAEGAQMGLLGPFTIVDLDEDHEDAILYRESFDSDSVHHDAKMIRDHRQYFEFMWDKALDEEKSLRRISSVRLELQSRLVNEGTT
jgi:transcriptional regulator with XRE-family HTH domain